MIERSPDPALEERVVRALIASGDIRPRRRWRWAALAAVGAVAAALVVLLHPWTPAHKSGDAYVLLLHMGPEYRLPAPGHMDERRAEYGRWADSLDRLGELEMAGRLDGSGDVSGLFIVRARDQAEADSIAASSPHGKYGGRTEVRRFIP
jgi:hypothetical protein